jgi:ATP-dependent helicase HrpA
MKARADRWRQDPGKDHRRSIQLAPWEKTLAEALKSQIRNAEQAKRLDELRWLIEEYRVSVFAQELGTPQPVSEKKLEQKLGEFRSAAAIVGAPPPPTLPCPPPPASVSGAVQSASAVKLAKLTSLGDLGRLFGR